MKKLLIVDDSVGWRKFHEAAIRQLFPDEFEIDTADSARSGNEKLYLNENSPYDIIFTDLQMESDFLPLNAGEWFVEQIQNFSAYRNTRIYIISASPSIRLIAERYNVDYIPKANCRNLDSYKVIID